MRGRRLRRTGAAACPADAGFTMIEVIVALAILGIIATAALGFTVRALKSSGHLQRAQSAVAVASSAMEQVRNLDPGFRTAADGTMSSNLVLGRGPAGNAVARCRRPLKADRRCRLPEDAPVGQLEQPAPACHPSKPDLPRKR